MMTHEDKNKNRRVNWNGWRKTDNKGKIKERLPRPQCGTAELY